MGHCGYNASTQNCQCGHTYHYNAAMPIINNAILSSCPPPTRLSLRLFPPIFPFPTFPHPPAQIRPFPTLQRTKISTSCCVSNRILASPATFIGSQKISATSGLSSEFLTRIITYNLSVPFISCIYHQPRPQQEECIKYTKRSIVKDTAEVDREYQFKLIHRDPEFRTSFPSRTSFYFNINFRPRSFRGNFK